MAQNSDGTTEVLDIDALMNSQVDEKDVGAVVTSLDNPLGPPVALKQGNNASSVVSALETAPTPPPTQNGGPSTPMEVIDLTRPVKTEGEASHGGSTSLAASPGGEALQNSSSGKTPTTPGASTPDGLTNSIAMGPFGSHLSILGNQLCLSQEEQASAYKKANILALSALAKKGGPSAKEMLAVQAKLQEFLTSLITLAGKTGNHLKQTVQLLVQRLVTGAITEEEFAARVETDLRSQHQPSLLPFLKNSVPHLKTRLQLQQAIMKELLQRMAAEKLRQQRQGIQQTRQQSPQQSQQTPAGQQQNLAGQQQNLVGQQQNLVGQQQNLVGQQQHLVGQQQNSMAQQQNSVTQLQMSQQKATNPGGTQQIQLQKGFSESVNLSQPQPQLSQLQQQQQQQQQHRASIAAGPPTSQSSISGLQQSSVNQLRLTSEQIARLTPEQQRFLYLHTMRKQQLLKAQQEQNSSAGATTQQNRLLSSVAQVSQQPPSTQPTSATTTSANFQTVLQKQQQLVKEQQISLFMGAKLPTQTTPKLASTSQFGVPIARGLTATSNSEKNSRTSFADLKLPVAVPGPSTSGSAHSNVKGRKKGDALSFSGKGKDLGDTPEDEEDDERMDIAGINIQEETAHFLPQSLGEVSRTCKDEVFLQMPVLRQRVASIARLYGITDVSDECLVLLSHATEEKMKDTLEKLTVIGRHRTEVLKDEGDYEVVSEVRGQLKVLEAIDRLNHKRKQEKEKEKILRAAKSRSKADDPEMAAKIKEQAKQLQLEEEQMIRNKAANATALAAIGSRRKRSSAVSLQQDSMVTGGLYPATDAGSSSGTSMASLVGTSTASRQHKRRVTSRDLVFYLEQERETRKSLFLYKSLLK